MFALLSCVIPFMLVIMYDRSPNITTYVTSLDYIIVTYFSYESR